MRLSIIAPDTVYEPDVDSSMEVRDLQALLKAEMESVCGHLTSYVGADLRPVLHLHLVSF
jgi:hypothetical protein